MAEDRFLVVIDDGGRSVSGFRGDADDCVVRAIAIATGTEYRRVYRDLQRLGARSPRNGVLKKYYGAYLLALGWRWVPLMAIGTGCQTHLKPSEFTVANKTTAIVRLSRHLSVVRHGRIHDTFDPSRGGTRCVYGYWIK